MTEKGCTFLTKPNRNQQMKNLILTLIFSALHILIFMIAREYLGMKGDSNFLLFWAMLGVTWSQAIRAEVKK